jgi:hypothetical protein
MCASDTQNFPSSSLSSSYSARLIPQTEQQQEIRGQEAQSPVRPSAGESISKMLFQVFNSEVSHVVTSILSLQPAVRARAMELAVPSFSLSLFLSASSVDLIHRKLYTRCSFDRSGRLVSPGTHGPHSELGTRLWNRCLKQSIWWLKAAMIRRLILIGGVFFPSEKFDSTRS